MPPLDNCFNQSIYRPRLSCELTREQYTKLQSILPHGFQKPLYQCLTDGVLEIYDKSGLEGLSAIVAKYISAQRVCELGIERTERSEVSDGHHL